MTYDDQYETCERTYATLCIYHNDLDPEYISSQLALDPSRTQRRPIGAWFLTTRLGLDSRDLRHHLDVLLDKLADKEKAIHELVEMGYEIRITCLWLSKNGQGGPIISAENMNKLARLNLDLDIDVG